MHAHHDASVHRHPDDAAPVCLDFAVRRSAAADRMQPDGDAVRMCVAARYTFEDAGGNGLQSTRTAGAFPMTTCALWIHGRERVDVDDPWLRADTAVANA